MNQMRKGKKKWLSQAQNLTTYEIIFILYLYKIIFIKYSFPK